MTIDPSKRSLTTQKTILLAFAARLREHPLLNQANVVVSDQPVPPPSAFTPGRFLISVSPGAGEFPYNLWANGQHATATEDGSVIVGIYSQSLADKPGRRFNLLAGKRDDSPSILDWKQAVLKILSVSVEDGVIQTWEPLDPDSPPDAKKPLLRDQPQPVRATAPLEVQKMEGWLGIQITYSCTWDWDLYDA